jgi:hypothetical protein
MVELEEMLTLIQYLTLGAGISICQAKHGLLHKLAFQEANDELIGGLLQIGVLDLHLQIAGVQNVLCADVSSEEIGGYVATEHTRGVLEVDLKVMNTCPNDGVIELALRELQSQGLAKIQLNGAELGVNLQCERERATRWNKQKQYHESNVDAAPKFQHVRCDAGIQVQFDILACLYTDA